MERQLLGAAREIAGLGAAWGAEMRTGRLRKGKNRIQYAGRKPWRREGGPYKGERRRLRSCKATRQSLKSATQIAVVAMLTTVSCLAQTSQTNANVGSSLARLERMPESLELRYALRE